MLIEQTWMDNSFQGWRNQELRQFTKETGIRVKLLPAPESAEPLKRTHGQLTSGVLPDSLSGKTLKHPTP